MTPIVLQHGLFGFSDFGMGKPKVTYFNRIDRAIARRGHPLIIPSVHPTGTIARRAAALKRAILDQLKVLDAPRDARVVIFAHSMGGLDARYMINRLGMENRVAALVTVCTPHRGSPYADWCLNHLGKRMGGIKLVNFLALDLRAVRDLATETCARFNEDYPDVPGVSYLSIAAQREWRRLPPIFMHSHRIVSDAEGPNDGVVSVRSATWGKLLGVWPCDHLHAINKRLLPEMRNATGDVSPRYLEVLDLLESSGVVVPAPPVGQGKR